MKWVLLLCVAGCAATADSSHRGTFTWGHEVRAFKPCGSAKTYWVVGDANVLQPLREQTRPIYLEALGAIDTESKRDGFARDYDGIFRLREIRQVSTIVPAACAG